jgi:hypothetical protein
MQYLIIIALGVLGSVLAIELYVWLLPLTGWLARQATRLLPHEDRERYLEQWIADLETLPVSLFRVLRCVDLYRAGIALRWAHEAAALTELRDLLVTKWTNWGVATCVKYLLQVKTWRFHRQLAKLKRLSVRADNKAVTIVELVDGVTSVVLLGARLVMYSRELGLLRRCEARISLALSSTAGTVTRYPSLRDELTEDRQSCRTCAPQYWSKGNDGLAPATTGGRSCCLSATTSN